MGLVSIGEFARGEVSEDSDGPVEWCLPMAGDQVEPTAARLSELTLRTEPAARAPVGRRQPPLVLLGKAAVLGGVQAVS